MDARVVSLLPALALAIAFSHWHDARAKALLQRWANDNRYRLVRSERRAFFRGPYFGMTSKHQTVYHVTVEDRRGRTRNGWVRCGGWWLGLMSDQVESTWDGDWIGANVDQDPGLDPDGLFEDMTRPAWMAAIDDPPTTAVRRGLDIAPASPDEGFEYTLVKSPIEAVAQAFEQGGADVVRNVAGQTFPQTEAPLVLLYQLRGQGWTLAAALNSEEDLGDRLSRQLDAETILLGYDGHPSGPFYRGRESGEVTEEFRTGFFSSTRRELDVREIADPARFVDSFLKSRGAYAFDPPFDLSENTLSVGGGGERSGEFERVDLVRLC